MYRYIEYYYQKKYFIDVFEGCKGKYKSPEGAYRAARRAILKRNPNTKSEILSPAKTKKWREEKEKEETEKMLIMQRLFS
jgi:hypothetical protein